MKMWSNLNCIDFPIIVAPSFWERFLTMMNSRIIRWCLKIKSMARCNLKQWVPDVGMRLGHEACSRNPPAVFNVQSGLSAASGTKTINRAENLLVSAGQIHIRPFLTKWLPLKNYPLEDANQDMKGCDPLKGTLENVMPAPCCQHWHILPIETEAAFLSFSWKSFLESTHVAYSLPQNPSKNSTNLCKRKLLHYA